MIDTKITIEVFLSEQSPLREEIYQKVSELLTLLEKNSKMLGKNKKQ